MFKRFLTIAAGGALVLGLTAASTHAWVNSAHREYLTFSRAVALPGVELAAGTYQFEVPDGMLSAGIVRVSSKDGRRVYLTQFTRQVPRPRGAEHIHVTLREAAANAAPPIDAWFPDGESTGRQFIY